MESQLHRLSKAQPKLWKRWSNPSAPEMVSESKEVIDYNQRYDELVLGKRPVDWGNIILIVMIGMLLIGGGAFVY